jgi:two-component system C4-dicarboxylate transport response regulator DctD
LRKRTWSGNLREVKACAEAFALGLFDLPTHQTTLPDPQSLTQRVAAFEAREIAAVLDCHRGNTLRAAQALGVPRRTLNDKMRRYGLQSDA